jgi:bla regulator protein blaR1
VTGPVLIDILRPRIVVPTDFDVRYGARERALMLAHERAHLAREDLLVGAVAMIRLCLFWFNPLMYWALNRLRFDQELACDAMVLRTVRDGRRQYARTLLQRHRLDGPAEACATRVERGSSRAAAER